MKKSIISIIACGVIASSFALHAQEKKLQVVLKNGNSTEYPLSEINYLQFVEDAVTPPSDEKYAYRVAIPTDFSNGRVQKVVANGTQIAEIDNEYVLAATAVMTNIYPMGDDGKADLTKGINTADGGTVVWNASTNAATITAGTGAPDAFYVVDGEIVTTVPDGYTVADATVSTYYLVDSRGSETNSYLVTKVGTQYWMAENLRATKYTDGSDITCYTSSEGTAFTNTTEGGYHVWNDNSSSEINTYGCLYNAYAFATEGKELAPEGWEVPTRAQWTLLRTAANKKPAYLKSTDEVWWGTGYAGTNETGFNVYPTGYYSNSTGDYADNEAWFWGSSTVYDTLYKTTTWDYVRITYKATSVVISSDLSGGHQPYFGHSVRCVRK